MVLALAVLLLISCKKDHTCECTTSFSGSNTVSSSTIHGKEKDAQVSCEAGSASQDGATTTCKLK